MDQLQDEVSRYRRFRLRSRDRCLQAFPGRFDKPGLVPVLDGPNQLGRALSEVFLMSRRLGPIQLSGQLAEEAGKRCPGFRRQVLDPTETPGEFLDVGSDRWVGCFIRRRFFRHSSVLLGCARL